MTDEELSVAALDRALVEHNERAKWSPLRRGVAGPHPAGGWLLQLLAMKPCGCGAHRAAATFRGFDLEQAAREAREFVVATTPPEEGDE